MMQFESPAGNPVEATKNIITEMYVHNPSNMTQCLYTFKGSVEIFCQINHGFEQKQPQFTSRIYIKCDEIVT